MLILPKEYAAFRRKPCCPRKATYSRECIIYALCWLVKTVIPASHTWLQSFNHDFTVVILAEIPFKFATSEHDGAILKLGIPDVSYLVTGCSASSQSAEISLIGHSRGNFFA